MAAPIVITEWYESIAAIYTNVHAQQEINSAFDPYSRLVMWNKLYFPILTRDQDVVDQISEDGQLGLLWQVPTLAMLNGQTNPRLGDGTEWIISYMDQLINLVQNTIWAIGFYPMTATQKADIVTAFNSAWTN